jgi:hypothetical protein
MADVFISYSRKDTAFVRQLFDGLIASGREAWVDWQGIDYSTKWWEEICTGIEDADNFVLVISPDALQSVYCHREIEYARQRNKRIISFLYTPIDEASQIGSWYTNLDMRPHEQMARQNWEALKSIQWIDYPALQDFDKGLRALLNTVEADPEHARLHTRLLLRVREWESRGRSPSALLRGDELGAYERWLGDAARDPQLRPQPTAEQQQFTAESRRVENEILAHEALRERRIRQFRLTAVAAVIIGVLALAATIGAVAQAANANAQVATATIAQGLAIGGQQTSAAREGTANMKVFQADATLTPIQQTLTRAQVTLQAGSTRLAVADAQITTAGQTLTPIPRTLTGVAQDAETASALVEALRVLVGADLIGGSRDFDIDVERAGFAVWQSLDYTPQISDFVLVAQIRWDAPDPQSECGFLIRYSGVETSSSTFYAVVLSREGRITAFARNREGWRETAVASRSDLTIRTEDGAVNSLIVIGQKDKFEVFINGKQVLAFVDSAFPSGTLGVFASRGDKSRSLICKFRAIRVFSLRSTGLLPSSTAIGTGKTMLTPSLSQSPPSQ